MKVEHPDIYSGKKLNVTWLDGDQLTGKFYGYNFDYDDDGIIFSEMDIVIEDGGLVSFTDREIESIEVLDDASEDTAD
ncbi:MAG: hypothetical protein LUI61_08295 [Firmicutes bacterium]|nr:hypothetical protein [Bacillota bacterium]MCD7787914.1 hypothetical protein [Bacillota bacterium]